MYSPLVWSFHIGNISVVEFCKVAGKTDISYTSESTTKAKEKNKIWWKYLSCSDSFLLLQFTSEVAHLYKINKCKLLNSFHSSRSWNKHENWPIVRYIFRTENIQKLVLL